MAIAGKLIGALVGSIAGPLGTLFGGFLGHLIDRAVEERRAAGAFAPGIGVAADPVSQAQVNFLTCLIGLSIAVANTEGRVRQSQIEAMKAFFRDHLPYGQADQELIQGLIDSMYLERDRIDVEALATYFRGTTSPAGRLLLLRLLLQIAQADREGVSRAEEEMIRRIAALLGIADPFYRQARAETGRGAGRAFEILGVSPDAGAEEIKAAYRKMAMENHPDRVASLGPELVKIAEEKFKAIQEAYDQVRREKGF
ncbi:MAG: TerB family tellurite resistance protein [Spirochaetes bacterium]|nr:TerB family tellurite resistance protein [Spirochaetota bacterium]